MTELIIKVSNRLADYYLDLEYVQDDPNSSFSERFNIGLQIIELEWILKELQDMNCQQCIGHEVCEKKLLIDEDSQDIVRNLNYCSNFKRR